MIRVVLFAEVPDFYAAVARSDDPGLADRPVVVGGNPRKRGLVQAASADARAAGVEVEMTILEALRLCPQARAVRTDMARYREFSRRLFSNLRRTLDRLEPWGLGAAYSDLSADPEPAEELAAALRAGVASELGLPLRVGIASGKFLARLAAEEAGEGGIRSVPDGGEIEFLHPLAIARLDGVGVKTAAALAELGARSIGDVAALGRDRLQEAFGTHGLRIHALAAGLDESVVRAAAHAQSLSRESTLGAGSLDLGAIGEALRDLGQHLESELRLQGLIASKVTLKLRYGDGQAASRSQSLAAGTAAAAEIDAVVDRLLERTQAGSRPVRRLAIQLGGLAPEAEAGRQLDLFHPDA